MGCEATFVPRIIYLFFDGNCSKDLKKFKCFFYSYHTSPFSLSFCLTPNLVLKFGMFEHIENSLAKVSLFTYASCTFGHDSWYQMVKDKSTCPKKEDKSTLEILAI